MARTSRADQNYFSISEGLYQWFSGTDRAQQVDNQPEPFVLDPENPQSWDAILKVSHSVGVNLVGAKVAQGRENSVDLNNRNRNISISGDFGMGGGTGDQVITVKGGCRDIRITGAIHSDGRNGHVVTGAWSDQSNEISENLDYSGLIHVSGKPLTFVLSRCRSVKLPPDAKVLRWRSVGSSVYWWAKWVAVKLWLFK